MRCLVSAVAALATTLVLAACRRAEDPAAKASLEEATITAEVRSRLLMAEGLKSRPLAVETRDGTVRITGTVGDSLEEQSVEAIAGRVKGVREVRLDLRIVPEPDSAATPAGAPRAGPAPKAAPEAPLPSREEAG